MSSGNTHLVVLRSHSESSRPTPRRCWRSIGPVSRALGVRLNNNNNNNNSSRCATVNQLVLKMSCDTVIILAISQSIWPVWWHFKELSIFYSAFLTDSACCWIFCCALKIYLTIAAVITNLVVRAILLFYVGCVVAANVEIRYSRPCSV